MSQILDFFADNKEVTQLIAKSVPAIMGFHQANKAKKAIYGPDGYQTKLDNIEKNRQEIVNPYANVTNPFANIQVATKAAEMQAEQTDIALANTLDTLRETGAGGATALAQAALKSKQGVAADIQRQEAQNQRLYAQGQQQMEMAQAKGEAFKLQAQENRDVRDINRLQIQMDLAQRQRAASLATGTAALASGIGGLSSFINPEVNNTEATNNTTIPMPVVDFSGGSASSNTSETGGSGMNSVSGINSAKPPANMPKPNENAIWIPGAGWIE
jgi:hypothetical protein|tara:strand:+ start:42 stop:857 length:816 start_codon:yes stop_codon:yes gene_type:complete